MGKARQVTQGFGTTPKTKPSPLRRRKEGGSSPRRRPHQSTKRTPSLYYRNSYETAPRKKTTHWRGKNNKVTHTKLGLPRVRPALKQGGPRHVWNLVYPPGAPGGGELSLQGVTGLARSQRGPHPNPPPGLTVHTLPNLVTLSVHRSSEPGEARLTRMSRGDSHFLPVRSSSHHPSIGSHSQPGPRTCPDFPDLSKC